MSRVGKQPVKVPSGVKVRITTDLFRAEGPKGKIDQPVHPDIMVKHDDAAGEIRVSRPADSKRFKALHGLTQRLVQNAVTGVSEGFEKRLQIVGVGYNARAQGPRLTLNLGFSNPVIMDVPEGVAVETPAPTVIVIKGPDKQKVGQFAAEIRRKRPPEPYKGKGVRYENEYVRRKAGKAFVSGQ
ncbi:MAG: 50S ribosomal protein L6 [Planctomycetes bacterium]|nr:50S ribosomal protein L6 [Planctomycetota bacterium]